MSIFEAELGAFYTGLRTGRPVQLPDLPIQYADYAEWQPRWVADEVRTRQLPYWRQALEDAPAALDLPIDKPRPPVQTFNGARYRFELPAALTEAVRELARAQGVTLYVVLLAAWNLLLHRCTGQEDIVVGTTSSTRSRPETQPIIGYFLTMLPLRTRVAGTMTFRDLLRATQATMLGAMDHNDIPFGLLLDELRVARDPARNPVYQNSFLFVNFQAPPLAMDGIEVLPALFDNGTAKDECMVCLFDDPAMSDTFVGIAEYNTDLFTPGAIEQLLRWFENLLGAAAADPGRLVGDYPLLSAPDAAAALADGSGPAVARERGARVDDLVLRQAALTPDRTAATDGTRQVTYAQLADRATRLAAYLRARGAGPEQIVAVCVEPTVDLPAVLLGVLLSGAAYLPLDPRHPAQRLTGLAADAGARIALSDAGLRDEFAAAGLDAIDAAALLETGLDAVAAEPPQRRPDGCLAYVIYTSGSTGQPKGVGIEHRALANYLLWARDRYPGAASNALLHSSIAYDLAVTSVYTPLICGGTVVVAPLNLYGEQSPAVAPGLLKITPSHLGLLNALSSDGLAPTDLVVGGEMLTADQLARWRERHPDTVVVNEYGPTEATVGCIAYSVAPGDAGADGSITVPIGWPIDNAAAYVLDDRLRPVPEGVAGELYLAGDILARGYLGRPGLTAERFVPCPFGPPGGRMYRTGDLAVRLHGGGLEFRGRADRQIKLRGQRIEPAEIEACLAAHPDVAQAAVIAREDGPAGRRLVAYVRPAAASADPQLLRAHVAAALPAHMVPSAIVAVERIPVTANGKLDEAALPAPQAERAVGRGPRDTLELEVARVWEDVLGIRPIGAQERFFDLGGHSVLALTLVLEIERRFGPRLPVEAIFQGATVEQFTALLRDGPVGGSLDAARLLEMRPGAGRPVYFPHQAAGVVLCYAPIAAHFEPADRPLYAIACPALSDGRLPYATFEHQAAAYADLITARQPHGPYDLVGWSYGGMIGHAIAAELERRGADVRLVMLSTSPRRHATTDPEPDRAAMVEMLAISLLQGQHHDALIPAARLAAMNDEEHVDYLLDLVKGTDAVPPGADRHYLATMLGLWSANLRLYHRYEQRPIRSGITLIRSAAEDAADFDGWRDLGLAPDALHVVPGDHFSMGTEPLAAVLAEVVGRVLAESVRDLPGPIGERP